MSTTTNYIVLASFFASFLLSAFPLAAQSNHSGTLSEHKMEWAGSKRRYLVHLPPQEKLQQPVPVLFHLHGGGGTAKGTVDLTFGRFNELADRDGFIVVYPQGLGKSWNDGRKAIKPKKRAAEVDDVGFLVQIVDTLKAQYQIDEARVFTTGMSNGGFMSTRLLCDRADVFRGGAILTASLSTDYLPECKPAQPVAVLVMNGTDDPLVPYGGGEIRIFKKSRGEVMSTNAYMKFWQDQLRCTEKKAPINLPDLVKDGTMVTKETYGNCDVDGALVLYKIRGGGHTWPGGKQYLAPKLIGRTCQDINACDVIWDFLKGQ